jgi:hypothetical protein
VGVALFTVFVTATSAAPDSVSTSVALLLAGFGSVAAGATVAVLVRLPVAAAEIPQAAVYVTLPPAGRLTESLMLPAAPAVQVPPPAPAHVQLQVSDAGNVSETVAVVLLGPAFDAVIV